MVVILSLNSVSVKGFAPFATGSVLLKTKYCIHFPTTPSHFSLLLKKFLRRCWMFAGRRLPSSGLYSRKQIMNWDRRADFQGYPRFK